MKIHYASQCIQINILWLWKEIYLCVVVMINILKRSVKNFVSEYFNVVVLRYQWHRFECWISRNSINSKRDGWSEDVILLHTTCFFIGVLVGYWLFIFHLRFWNQVRHYFSYSTFLFFLSHFSNNVFGVHTGHKTFLLDVVYQLFVV